MKSQPNKLYNNMAKIISLLSNTSNNYYYYLKLQDISTFPNANSLHIYFLWLTVYLESDL